jgi:hypothetical protein
MLYYDFVAAICRVESIVRIQSVLRSLQNHSQGEASSLRIARRLSAPQIPLRTCVERGCYRSQAGDRNASVRRETLAEANRHQFRAVVSHGN